MVHVVLEFGRTDVVVGAQEIAVLEAIVVVPIDRRRAVEQPGNAVVGNVVRGLVKVAEDQAGGMSNPSASEGATPKRRFSATSRPATFSSLPMRFRRNAAPEPSGQRLIEVRRHPPGEVAELDGMPNEERPSGGTC